METGRSWRLHHRERQGGWKEGIPPCSDLRPDSCPDRESGGQARKGGEGQAARQSAREPVRGNLAGLHGFQRRGPIAPPFTSPACAALVSLRGDNGASPLFYGLLLFVQQPAWLPRA